jgi:hypothetical protein
LEKNRIYIAAVVWLIAISVVTTAFAQDALPDTLDKPSHLSSDTLESEDAIPPDSAAIERRAKEKLLKEMLAKRDSAQAVEIEIDTFVTSQVSEFSIYEKKLYIAKGIEDEIKPVADLFIVTPGLVGAPALPVEYINVAGLDVTLNGLPFAYSGLYRPYVMGTDLNVFPWEFLNGIDRSNGHIDISVGAPPGDAKGSDVEVARGSYGYSGTRWRFYQPLNSSTYAVFAVGFKKTDPFYTNSDFDGFQVTGGIKRKILDGSLALNLYRHRAKAGILAFDFIPQQISRQSRGIDRAEVGYGRAVGENLEFSLAGFFHRSAQTIRGYTDEVKSTNDLGGGKADIAFDTGRFSIGVVSEIYSTRLYGIDNVRPSYDVVNENLKASGRWRDLSCSAALMYSWNKIDGSAYLPDTEIRYDLDDRYYAIASFSKYRGVPDLYLRFFDDYVDNLGFTDALESYRFEAVPGLKTPVSTSASIGMGVNFPVVGADIGVNRKRINDQITLSYSESDPGDILATPANFDDEFTEITATLNAKIGPFSGEASAAYRWWDDRYFSDNLEKGPAVIGFGRLSFRRQFFIPRLFFGGSVEMEASSRRDYRSVTIGYTDAYAVFHGRLEFQYKDFRFYFNEDNLMAHKYYPLWPYPGRPRTIWWGFNWKFYN